MKAAERYNHPSSHAGRLGASRDPARAARVNQNPAPSAETKARREALYPSTRQRRAEDARDPTATPLAAMARRHAEEKAAMGREHRKQHLELTSKHDTQHAEMRGARDGASVPREMRADQNAEREKLNQRQARENEFMASRHRYERERA